MKSSPSRLITLDILRGVAALMVCWFHLTNGNPQFLPNGLLKLSGTYGWLGVEVFFVISGFIIPYALYRGNYHISNYGTFICKRIIRLDPPYVIAILVVLVLEFATLAVPGFHGPPFHFSIIQLLLHLGYANVFFGYPWLNPVFWTLAIELQYYVMVGLLFFLIAHRSLLVRICCFGGLAGLAFLLPASQFIFPWLFLFMLGMIAFQLRVGIHSRRQFFVWLVVLGIGAWRVDGALIAATTVAATLVIGLVDARAKSPLLFLGNISYSLYLLHAPIGGRVINLGMRFVHSFPSRFLLLMAAMVISIVAAWLLYKYVEQPAQQWSSRIRYKTRPAAAINLPKSSQTAL